MNETLGHPAKGRSLRFYIWLAVISLVSGTAATLLLGLRDIENGQVQFSLRFVIKKILMCFTASWLVFFACFLIRAQIKFLFFWLFSWRMLKRALKALAVLLALALVLYVEENWRGKRAWAAYRHQLEASGEHLDFDYYIPLPVPDDQNFALTPVVASCYSQYLDRNGHRLEPPNTNVVNRLKMDIMRHGVLVPLSDTNPQYYEPHVGKWRKTELTDLKAWQFYYRLPQDTNSPDFPSTNEFPVAAQPQAPAADVLLALSKYDSAVEELRLASRLPASRFPLNYATNNPELIILPHLKSLESCASVLRLRAVAELEAGQSDRALSDIRLILYLAGSIHNEPLVQPLHSRLSMTDYALQPVWEGLARQKWSDDQLAAVTQDLAGFDARKDCESTIRADLGRQLKFIEYIRTERMANSINCLCGDIMWGPTLFYRLSPNGWFYLNERSMARMYEAALATEAELNQRILSPEIGKRVGRAEALACRRHLIPDNYFMPFLVPPLTIEVIDCARTQAALDMARIACALERYRLAHGGYPERLDALAPLFVEKIPHDVINGQPLHYRRTENGRFLLYSVGWNGRDDGGVPGDDRPYYLSNPTGDWVWQYPARN